MKKKILAVILLSSISLAESHKAESMNIHQNRIQPTYINDGQERLEHKRLLARQLSTYFWKRNNIIAMEQEKRKNNLLANLSNN